VTAATVRLAGAAGQGVQTAADLLGRAATRSGLFAACHTDVESRVRGGVNFMQFEIGDGPVQGVIGRVDVLVAFTDDALVACRDDLAPGAVVVGPDTAPVGLTDLLARAGSSKVIGTIGMALAAAHVGLDRAVVTDLVRERFAGVDTSLLDTNLRACELAFAAVSTASHPLEQAGNPGRLWLAGHQALSLGAVAGGVSFMAAYPMSPATGCLTDLAAWSSRTGVVTVQVEDEIAAINMVAGAAYAGTRAMTATSGGGFALMTEGLSLIGEIEAPAVIVLAQRPGPATGMATRTAQEDLFLAAYGGHGTFPRILLAPRDVADCFVVASQAFDLAEAFQVPVFIMTDQLLQDSHATVDTFSVDDLPRRRHFLTTDELEAMADYRRYEITDDGISPLAAPGASRHTVMVDSHIHDERGHLTECPKNATSMARKLLAKERTVANAAWEPFVEGDVDGRTLVVSWGSTYGTVERALAELAERGRRAVHVNLRWIWPAPRAGLCELFERAGRVVSVETSVGGVFARYLEHATGYRPDAVVTRLDGRPFTTEALVDHLEGEVAR